MAAPVTESELADPIPAARKSKASNLTLRLFVVGGLLGALLIGRMISQADGDPFVLVAVSETKEFPRSYIEAELGRTVVKRPGIGHDGQYFFLQSLDPFFLDPRTSDMDNPEYRGQRLVYPLIAGLGGTLPLRWVPWGMAATQVLFFAVGTAVTGELAAELRRSRWWGLAFTLNPGVWAAVQIGGASAVGLAFGFAGVLFVLRGRFGRAAVLFAFSALTREVMLAMALGVMLQEWRRSGRLRLGLILVPGLASAVWAAYLRWQIDGDFPAGGGAIGPPFRGIYHAANSWFDSPSDSAFAMITIGAVIFVGVAALRSSDLIASSGVLFSVLFLVLTAAVLRENFDYSRAILPLYTVGALLVAERLPPWGVRSIRSKTTP